MTLPPRLPAPRFLPDPADVPGIVTAARRRRARRGGLTGAAFALSVLVLIAVNAGVPTQLSVVEPAAPPAGTETATPSPTPPPAGPATEPAPAPASGAPAPAPGTPPTSLPAAVPSLPGRPPTTPSARALAPHATLTREKVEDSGAPCQEEQMLVTTTGEEPRTVCTRYHWPQTVTSGSPVTFVGEYCVDRDMRDKWREPVLSVWTDTHRWDFPWQHATEWETLEAGYCFRWTVAWNGIGWANGPPRQDMPLPRGEYTVNFSPRGYQMGWRPVGQPSYGPDASRRLVIE